MKRKDRVSYLFIACLNLLFGIPVGVWQLVTGHIVGAFVVLVAGGASLLAFRRVGRTAPDG